MKDTYCLFESLLIDLVCSSRNNFGATCSLLLSCMRNLLLSSLLYLNVLGCVVVAHSDVETADFAICAVNVCRSVLYQPNVLIVRCCVPRLPPTCAHSHDPLFSIGMSVPVHAERRPASLGQRQQKEVRYANLTKRSRRRLRRSSAGAYARSAATPFLLSHAGAINEIGHGFQGVTSPLPFRRFDRARDGPPPVSSLHKIGLIQASRVWFHFEALSCCARSSERITLPLAAAAAESDRSFGRKPISALI